MALTHHERVGKAMELLRQGLGPFVEREVRERVAKGIVQMREIRRRMGDPKAAEKPVAEWDAAAQLKVMWEFWNDVFRFALGRSERSLVQELRDWRNKWAHQERFSSDDAYRVIDSVERLLAAVSAPQADQVAEMKGDLLRQTLDQQTRNRERRSAASSVAGASSSLTAWREVVKPHDDVSSGKYQHAEFAADLWHVHMGGGSPEYRDPESFFRRTYLTSNLRKLLVGAVQRASGKDGDPVVQLQTNFGGGKTHSMLALYHLLSGEAPRGLDEVGELLEEAGVEEPPRAKRVVLVGNRMSPGNPDTKPDGTVVRTLWGELAWQLGGRDAFEKVRLDDEKATSPGDRLRALLEEHGPVLILIDEWVAYARQLHEQSDLPGGSFETQFTFAQALTESAKVVDDCLLVVSLPASASGGTGSGGSQADDAEVGGVRGRDALDRLANVVGRVATVWQPATSEEGFEIVRRRLFEPLDGKAREARDLTARRFGAVYRRHKSDFPSGCHDADYEKRIRAAYPIHPEIFDRLYTDWSSLAKFQRTRGVLRLMASVIHSLWESGDRSPLIMPSTIPVDDARVLPELTRYLADNWTPIIDADVDGRTSLPHKLDAEFSNLGKHAAARRVARTVYLGSAPLTAAANRGVDDRKVNLGCVMPGEPVSVFGDALRRLASRATYLYQDRSRYWYDTQPTVAKLAQQRATELAREPHLAGEELARRLQKEFGKAPGRSKHPRVHLLPRSAADVPDHRDARLVVLPSDRPYAKEAGSEAQAVAAALLESRGSGPRIYRNTLVFLAADRVRMQDMDEAVRDYLAWRSILEDKESLNLDPHQARQAESSLKAAADGVEARLPEVYKWLLVPEQADAASEVTWRATEMRNRDGVASRAFNRIADEDYVIPRLGATILRAHMDNVPLWRGDHVPLRQLIDDFATYVYLPRLAGPEVVAEAVAKGLGTLLWADESFAYAESWDEDARRYQGLTVSATDVTAEDRGLVVKPEAALAQLEGEKPDQPPAGGEQPDEGPRPGSDGTAAPDAAADDGTQDEPSRRPQPRRFHGAVVLDPNRAGRDAGRVAEEVIAHLAGLIGSDVRVTLEIEASFAEKGPDDAGGVPDHVVRAVTENCRVLKFESHGFETE